MAQRENTFYLVITIVSVVLFVLSSVAFFFVLNERKEIEEQLAMEKDTNLGLNRDIGELRDESLALKEVIVGQGRSEGFDTTKDPLESWKTKELEKVSAAFNAARQDLKLDDQRSFTHLTEPYGEFKGLLDKYKQLKDGFSSEASIAAENLSSELKAHEEAINELTSQLQSVNSKLADAEGRVEDSDNLRQSEQAKHVRTVASLRDEIGDLRVDFDRMRQRLNNRVENLLTQNQRLADAARQEKDFAELEPDGQLYRYSPSLGKGWIDLGRRDRLMNGLVFRVFQIVKGGRKIYKGRVEVRKVGETAAEVFMLDEVDGQRLPLSKGDFVASPFYDKKEKPVFVFAGRELASRDVTFDFLKLRLESYGVQLGGKVDTDTTYLVALKNYDKTPEYQTARNLGVPLLREQDVLDFIGN